MDLDDVEDMLLGVDASDDISDDNASNISDDDLLDEADVAELTLWDEAGSPSVTPFYTDQEMEKDMLAIARPQNKPKEQPASATMCATRDRHWVIARVEGMLERILDGFLGESTALRITLQSRAGLSRRRTRANTNGEHTPQPRKRDINFPGATAQEAWNFTVLLRILELVHAGLIDNTIMTKRDLYYRHPDLFVKQSVVDRYIDDLACTFGVSRSQLNVTAAAKGLVSGSFSIIREDVSHFNGMKDKGGALIPKIGEHDTIDTTMVTWVLIIEKEATFRSLLSSAQWDKLGSHGLALTAKGYPDIASREFLRHVAEQAPHIPMYALVDLDPDGIAIMSTYKYGSYRLAHEDVSPKDTHGLSLPNIQWLGIKRHHVSRTPVDEGGTDTGVMPELQGLMRLTARDRTKAARMLEWDLCAEDGPEEGWRHELQTMLMLNTKAEMQILDELPGGLVSWLCGLLDPACEPSPELLAENSGSDDGLLF